MILFSRLSRGLFLNAEPTHQAPGESRGPDAFLSYCASFLGFARLKFLARSGVTGGQSSS